MKIYQELVILGLLKSGPKHGYEIRKLLKNVLRVFTSFESTSIYYPLKVLEEKGYLEKEFLKKGSRPQRYVYKLTPRGESYVDKLLLDNILTLQRPFVNMDLSLFFFPHIDKKLALSKVKVRLRALERLRRWLLKRIHNFTPQAPYLKKILEHNLFLIEAEIEFNRRFISECFSLGPDS